MRHLLLPSTIISTYKEQTNMFPPPIHYKTTYVIFVWVNSKSFWWLLTSPHYKLLATAKSILATVFNSVPSQLAVDVNDLGSSQGVQKLSWELVKKDVKI